VWVGVAGSAVGLAVGVYFLTQIGLWPLIAVMALGAVAVLIYTQVFARTGVGEVFAGLGLGLLPVVGTALVQRGTIGPAAWVAGVPAFLMTFNLLLLNEFPDEAADRAGGRLNIVLMLGRKGAALVYAAAALLTPLAIVAAVATDALPPQALAAVVPSLLLTTPLRWAFGDTREPVPIPALGMNVAWNLTTNTVLAAALVVALVIR